MNKKKKYTIATLAAVVLVGLFYFYNMGKPSKKSRGEKLATLIDRKNLVRHRKVDQIKWDNLNQNIDIYENEMLFTPLNSSAKVEYINKTVLDIPENTLIKFVKSSDDINLDIEKGFLNIDFSNSKKKTTIGMGDNKFTVLPTLAMVKFHRTDKDQYEISVVKGAATIKVNDQDLKIRNGDKLQFGSDSKKAIFIPADLSLESPGEDKRIILDETTKLKFKWISNKDAPKYKVLVSKDSSFEFMVAESESEKTEVEIDGFTNNVYFWKVVATVNGKKIESTVFRFKAISKRAPKGLTPKDGSTVFLDQANTEREVSFNWENINADSYEVVLQGEEAEIKKKVKGTIYTQKNLSPGKYTWKVRTYTAEGVTRWSKSLSFSVFSSEDFRALSPLPNSEINYQYKMKPVVFKWESKLKGPYILVIREDNIEGKEVLRKKIENSTYTWNKINKGPYQWQVLLADKNKTPLAKDFKFKVFVNDIINIRPKNNSIYTKYKPRQLTRLSWVNRFRTKDVEYNVQVATDPDFLNIVKSTKTKKRFSYLYTKPKNTYYWRVRSSTEDEYIVNSTSQSFSVVRPGPLSPPRVFPEFMLYTSIEDVDNYKLYWEKRINIASYIVEIYRDKNLTKLVLKDEVEDPFIELGGTLYGQYYYRIKAKDHHGRESRYSRLSKMVSRVSPLYFFPEKDKIKKDKKIH